MTRKKAGPNEMRLMFTSLHNRLGRMSLPEWFALSIGEQQAAIAAAAQAADMNPRTVELRNYAALRHEGINAGFPPALMASSIAYAVGYTSDATHMNNILAFQAKTAANAVK